MLRHPEVVMPQENKKQPDKLPSRKRTKQRKPDILWHFESMDLVNRAMQGTNDIEQMMKDVLDTLLSVFECDRAFLVYPCDPEAVTWNARARNILAPCLSELRCLLLHQAQKYFGIYGQRTVRSDSVQDWRTK